MLIAPKSIGIRVIALPVGLCLFALLATQTVYAQDRPTRLQRPQRAPVQNVQVQAAPVETIPVIRVTPSPTLQVALPEEAKPAGTMPAPMSHQAKLKALLPPPPPPAAGGNVAGPKEPTITTMKLTAKEPFKHERGYLLFNETRHIDTNGDFATWFYPQNPGMGYVQARVKLEGGKRYLADMSVSCNEPQTFTFNAQKTSLQAGSHHLLLILEPQQSGWVSLTLSNDERWAFYSFEISVMD
jgi:hypothetical protein